jgi:spore coat polysaccharide biosynthesis protein SpsF
MLSRQIERLKRCSRVDGLVLATSINPEDQALEGIAREAGLACYRGSLDDVLDRFYQAALPYRPSHIVRLTGDCPLADWQVIDKVVRFALDGGYDYASNTIRPTWPDGLDVEVVRFEALETAWKEATLPLHREHVMPFIHTQPQRFCLGNLENNRDLSGLRWTVDEPQDFDFVTRVFSALYPRDPAFTTEDILDFLSGHPEIVTLNSSIERNEDYLQALARLKTATAHD